MSSKPFSPNPGIQNTIDRLLAIGCPPLPVAPAQDADRYPAKDKQGSVKHDKHGDPTPAFTGKNPSYLDSKGTPHLINHHKYQSDLPTEANIRKWFENPANGIGTLGGHGGITWIDFDAKHFADQAVCDTAVTELIAKYNLGDTWVERTGSGGWRIAVKPSIVPAFTNFALSEGGDHVGEVLGHGRFTVLAPTIHPNGQTYELLSDRPPIAVESLESIGIFPHSKSKPPSQRRERPKQSASPIGATIKLEDLGNPASREILQGRYSCDDRSAALTAAVKEWYGWENFCDANRVAYSGTAELLAQEAGAALGLDSDRVDRILKTIDAADCHPAALSKGGEDSCWKRIRKLDRETYDRLCPETVKQSIESDKPPSPAPKPEKLSTGDHSRSKLIRRMAAVENAVAGKLRLNQLTNSLEFCGKPLHAGRYRLWLAELIDDDVPEQDALQILGALGEQNAYHPVKDWLEELHQKHNDSTIELLQNPAQRLLKTWNPIYDTYLKKQLIAAVARIYQPGCKVDACVILQGAQGLLKSTFWRTLAGDDWFDDSLGSDIDNKDEVAKLHQTWFEEWAEIDRITSKKEANTIKPFLTRQVDRYRAPYDRTIEKHPRGSVIVGSVNPTEFLLDETGNRRYWVIPVTEKIDIAALEAEREPLWAAAVAAYKAGEQWHLTEEEEAIANELNKRFELEDVWLTRISEWLANPGNTITKIGDDGTEYMTAQKILDDCLKIEVARQSQPDKRRVSKVLSQLGWQPIADPIRLPGHKATVRAWSKQIENDDEIEIEITIIEEPSPSQEDCRLGVWEAEPMPQPKNATSKWRPTHQLPDGTKVKLERQYGAGLAAVRNSEGKAVQVQFAELSPIPIGGAA